MERLRCSLLVLTTIAAAVGVAQGAFCPGELESESLGRWFFHLCDRARGFFSIYATLAGVLVLVLLATAPRVVETGPRRWARAPASWGVMVVGRGPARSAGRDPSPSEPSRSTA